MSDFETGIPDITVIIRENADNNAIKLDIPDISVSVQQGDEYLVNIQPNTTTVSRTGSFTSYADMAGFAATASYFSGSAANTVSASYALTASYVSGAASNWDSIANKPLNLVSSSVQVINLLPTGTVSSSAQYPGWVTASSQINYTQLQNIPSGILSSSAQINTGSFTGSFTGVFTGIISGAAATASYIEYNDVANKPTLVSASSQIDVRQTTGVSTLATTGSNTLAGIQHITDTTNSLNYTNGALIVDGGVGISKDVNISGSLNVYGLLTAVSQSVLYVTSSQLNVGTNIITVNTDTVLRFGGLEVFDSGSPNHSGSLLWDSYYNRWIYQNESGSGYNSAILIAGPKNTGSLGQETGLVVGRIPVASGDDHIDTDISLTPLRVEGGKLHVENDVYVTGSITASTFIGSLDYQYINNKPTLVSSSAQIQQLLPTGTVSSSAQYAGWVTSSSQIDYTQLQNIPTGIVSSSVQINTGSFTGSFNGIFTGIVSGAAATASYVEYNDVVNKPTLVSASSQIDYTQIQNVPLGIVSSSTQINTGSFSGSITTASYALTASYVSTSATSWDDVVNKPDGLISSSTQATTWTVASSSFATSASNALTASYALNVATLDIDTHVFNANGVTNTFILSQSYDLNSLEVYVGGLALTKTIDFTILSNTLSLITIPPSESNVLVRAYVNVTDGASGTFYGNFIGTLIGAVESASFAQTASYALNAGAGAGFPYSGSAVITGSLTMVNTANEGGITGSLFGTASVADGFDIVFAGEYETGSTIPLVNNWSPLSASYAVTASYINEIILSSNPPIIPKIGSVYFSSSFIYVYDGTQYRSASLN